MTERNPNKAFAQKPESDELFEGVDELFEGVDEVGGVTPDKADSQKPETESEGHFVGADEVGGLTADKADSHQPESEGHIVGADEVGGLTADKADSHQPETESEGHFAGADEVGEFTPDPDKAVSHQPETESEGRFVGADEVGGLTPERSPAALGITLDDVIQVLRQKLLTLLAGAVVGLALVASVLAWTTPLYIVSAKLVVSRQVPGDLVDTDSGSSVFIATQAEVMSSLSVVAAAVATLPRPGHLGPEDDAVKDALDAVHASAITGTRVIALGYVGADAVYGAALLRAMVSAYSDELRDTTRSGQVQALNTKAAELDVLLEEIAEQEAQIKEMRGINIIIGTADEAAAAQLDRLQGQTVELRGVRSRRIELESRLATGGAELNVDDPGRHSLQEDLRLAEAELARAILSLTAEHPAVLAAERNVEVLRAQVAASVRASPLALQQQIAEATRHEVELTALQSQSRGRLEAIESHRREENELLAELARTRSLADSWRQQLFDQRLVARLVQAGNVGVSTRIITDPVAPENPVWPRPKLMLPAGLIFGVTGGFVFGLVSLRRRRSEIFTRVSNP